MHGLKNFTETLYKCQYCFQQVNKFINYFLKIYAMVTKVLHVACTKSELTE